MYCPVCEGIKDESLQTCPRCGRGVYVNHFRMLDMMEEKYGTKDLLELSEKKLTFGEIAAIRIFIERVDRHSGDATTYQRCLNDGTYKNLDKRISEIMEETSSV